MAKIYSLLISSLAIIAASNAFGACDFPREVTIPTGATATADEMVDGQSAVKTYMAEMEAYLQCLDDEAAALGEEQQTDETKSLHVSRYNAAVDAMENVAAQFNEQVRAYKEIND